MPSAADLGGQVGVMEPGALGVVEARRAKRMACGTAPPK
jgi:hypothetical protein